MSRRADPPPPGGGRSPLRELVRRAHRAVDRARFRLWALRLDCRLRRNGSRLILDCPQGGRFDTAPAIELLLIGEEAGSLTLRLAPGASLGRGLILEIWAGAESVLELGEGTLLGAACRLQLHGGAIRLGRQTQVGDLVLMQSRGEIWVGDRVRVTREVILHADQRITIEDHVGVGERTSMVDSDHEHVGGDLPFLERAVRTAPVLVSRNVWIGANSVLLRGTMIGANSVVGAGSVVTGGEHPSGWLIAGAPARALRELGPGD